MIKQLVCFRIISLFAGLGAMVSMIFFITDYFPWNWVTSLQLAVSFLICFVIWLICIEAVYTIKDIGKPFFVGSSISKERVMFPIAQKKKDCAILIWVLIVAFCIVVIWLILNGYQYVWVLVAGYIVLILMPLGAYFVNMSDVLLAFNEYLQIPLWSDVEEYPRWVMRYKNEITSKAAEIDDAYKNAPFGSADKDDLYKKVTIVQNAMRIVL